MPSESAVATVKWTPMPMACDNLDDCVGELDEWRLQRPRSNQRMWMLELSKAIAIAMETNLTPLAFVAEYVGRLNGNGICDDEEMEGCGEVPSILTPPPMSTTAMCF